MESRNWQLNSDNSALSDIVRRLKIDKEALRTANAEKERKLEILEARIEKLEGKREMAEVRGERAEERVRLLRRGFTGRGILDEGGLRWRLEEKIAEVEMLEEKVRVLDEKVSDRNILLAEKDNKLGQLRRWLFIKGFHVDGI